MTEPDVTTGVTLIAILLPLLVGLAVYVWTALALSAVFRKAGEEPFKAWVPFLNIYVLLQLGGYSGWFVLLILVPFVGQLALWIVLIMAYHRINTAFGLGTGMTVLAALLLPVWASIVGWGSASWQGSAAPAGPLRQGPALDARVGVANPAPPVSATGVPAFAPPVAPPVSGVPAAPVSGQPAAPVTGVPAAPVTGVPAAPGAPPLAQRTPPASVIPGVTPAVPAPTPAAPIDSVPSAAPGPAPAVAFSEPPRPAAPAFPPAPATRAEARAAERAPESPDAPEPWAPPMSSTSAPAVAARATRYSPPELDSYVESSSEVSAVAGAPVLGAPRSASGAVSAQHAELADDALDETILAVRRRPGWELVLPEGKTVALSGDVVIIGRRPGADPAHPGAQLISVSDETRTMSKTHARLELHMDAWRIIDLDSTNGVVVTGENGAEREVSPGIAQEVDGLFLLGDAELRLRKRNP